MKTRDALQVAAHRLLWLAVYSAALVLTLILASYARGDSGRTPSPRFMPGDWVCFVNGHEGRIMEAAECRVEKLAWKPFCYAGQRSEPAHYSYLLEFRGSTYMHKPERDLMGRAEFLRRAGRWQKGGEW